MNKAIIRNDFLLIISFIIKCTKLTSPLIVLLIIKFNKYRIISLIGLLFCCFFILIFSFAKWYNIKLTLTENNIEYNLGIFFAKLIKIPLNNLTTIKLEQNLIQKIFNIYNLKINTGNINKKNSKINMLLKKDQAFYIEKLIKDNRIKSSCLNEDINKIKVFHNEPIFKIKAEELILLAITDNNITFGIGVVIATREFLKKLKKYLDLHIVNAIEHPIIDFKIIYKTYGIYIILGLLILFLIISTIISVIQKFIKFYNFRIYKDEKNITIKYGLISKKNYTLPIEKIVAIKLNQNFIRQVLKLYKFRICIIGYGQEKNEEAILYPIVSHSNANKIIDKLLPEFNCDFETIAPPKRALSKFMLLPIIASLLVYFILIILNNQFRIIIFLLPILILSRYLNFKNIVIGFNKNVFLGINRGFYKNALILKSNKIQLIETKSTYFQRRKQLCTYKIQYPNGSIKLKHLDNSILKELRKII